MKNTQPTRQNLGLAHFFLSPIAGAKVFSSYDVSERFATVTDGDGAFRVEYYLPACPCFTYMYDGDLWAEIPYKNYNPLNSEQLPFASFFASTPTSDVCSGYHYCPRVPASQKAEIAAIHASTAYPANYYRRDIKFDAMIITGEGQLTDTHNNPIPAASTTAFATAQQGSFADEDPASLSFDFDLDRQADQAVLHNGEYYVYLGGRAPEYDEQSNAPINEDLRRLPDQLHDYQDRGLLESISIQDLKETDLYIYRVSTGELIVERENLKPQEYARLSSGGVDDNANTGSFFYRQLMRGPRVLEGSLGNRLSQWWSDADIKLELFNNFQADFLRMGEEVQIIAINRPTGYIGSAIATLAFNTETGGNTLDVPIDTLRLQAPNLKVRAERGTAIELGLSASDNIQEYLIGSEGAGLTSDKYIAIKTEWFDHDGRPLPSDLPGYSGTLAKIVGDQQLNTDSACTSSASPIGIKPGSRIQLLKLGDNCDLGTEHYYVYVCGHNRADAAQDKCFDFDNTNAIGRPQYYVPVKVPFYDEVASRQQYNAYRYGKEDGIIADSAEAPEAIYRWHYRPEMQFSVFDLDVAQVNAVKDQEEGSQDIIDLLTQETPVLGSDADYAQLLFDLLINEGAPLERFGPDQELVFAIGEDEVLATFGEDQTLQFANLDHLGSLQPEDFLSIRLYANNDAGNILWEYAFWMLNVGVATDDVLQHKGTYYVNADEPTIDLVANLAGYSVLSDEVKSKAPERIFWRVKSGSATLSPASSVLDESGSVQTTVSLAPNSSNIAHIEAFVVYEGGMVASPVTIGVVPGKPRSIALSSSGTAYLKGIGQVEIEATVRDKNTNLVTNGTGVLIREYGHINVVTTTGITDQGKVQATLTGGSAAGSYQVEVLSGEALASTDIAVAPLSVSVVGLPSRLDAGAVYPLTATVSGGVGSLAGIFLDIGADGGMISARDTVTDSNGELHFTYRAPSQAGSYNVGIKLDVNNPQLFGFNVEIPTGADEVQPERKYLVAGAADNNGSIVSYSGSSATIEYAVESELTLKGVAGDTWSLNLNDPHLPNIEPMYLSRFNDIYWDSTKQYRATGANVFKSSSLHDGLYAITQDPETVVTPWSLDNSDDFIINNPSYNFWLNLGDSGELMSIANDSITLRYSAGTLNASAKSLDDEGIEQTAVASVAGLSQDKWYAVAISVSGGVLTLAVDQQQTTSVMASSALSYSNVADDEPWLRLDEDFNGKIAGLRIYDLDNTPLLQLSQSSGIYDDAGQAVLTVALTDAAKLSDMSISAVTVGLVDSDHQISTLNVLSKKVVGDMASALHSVTAVSNIHADDVMQKMPMHQYFPNPKVGAANYVSSFALQSNTSAATDTVVASLAWLKLEDKYPILHDDVETLQTYFADSQYPDLVLYAAEYMQQASVEASYGNNFWLRAMATSFKVWAEMAASHPDDASQIASAIQNRTDFWAWVRILSIPANGWATATVPVPRPDITCDKVAPTVNIGTPLEYSAEPCRASGAQMASLIQALNEIDPSTQAEPALLTTYLTHILAGTQVMPMEYKKWFSGTDTALASNLSRGLIPEAHAIIPAVVGYAFRAMAIALKQTIRKAAGGAPANFVAFMQNGTTSRLKPEEILPAIAYLSSRLADAPDALCNGCKRLEEQVSDTVKEDIAAWFISMGLARKGEIADEKQQSKSCSIAYLTHGKGFETLGTAMYHALFEFGSLAGIAATDKYEILLSDPRTKESRIDVGLMEQKAGSTELALYNKFQRKPDLVLAGQDEGKRTWIEFKSWLYNPATLKKAKHWKGFKSESDLQYTNANRQHFLDFAATKDVLSADYWKKENDTLQAVKPSEHITWFQVWSSGKRSWRELKKDAKGKYYLEKTPIHRSVSRPWISTDDIVGTVDKSFQDLQRFLAGVGSELDSGMYEASIGHKKAEHDTKHTDKQVAKNFAELLTSTIRPFNVKTFLALELGSNSDEGVEKIKENIYQAIGSGDFTRLQQAIDSNDLTEAQVAQLREVISDEIDTMLGPLQYLLFDIPGLSFLEDKLADLVVGEELEIARKKAVEYQFPQDTFENFCEDQ